MHSRINKDTLLCMSLSGRPGNFGTRFQNYLYAELGLNFVYKAFTTNDIAAAVGGIRALGIRGCAISMPFKETCMEFLDEIEPSARGIQSVNTILNEHGKLIGSNTDYIAVRALLENNSPAHNVPFALFGSGGMAKAVACALRDVGYRGTIVARNEVTGPRLAQQYGFDWKKTSPSGSRLLINASPVGMAGGAEEKLSPFSDAEIATASLIFDVVAIPMETPLILRAKALGKPVVTGFEVITRQALEQFVLYTGIRPEPALVEAAASFARG